MNPWRFAIVFALGLPVLTPGVLTQHAADPLAALSDKELLGRAAEYVRRVTQAMSTVVLEERYVQVRDRPEPELPASGVAPHDIE